MYFFLGPLWHSKRVLFLRGFCPRGFCPIRFCLNGVLSETRGVHDENMVLSPLFKAQLYNMSAPCVCVLHSTVIYGLILDLYEKSAQSELKKPLYYV